MRRFPQNRVSKDGLTLSQHYLWDQWIIYLPGLMDLPLLTMKSNINYDTTFSPLRVGESDIELSSVQEPETADSSQISPLHYQQHASGPHQQAYTAVLTDEINPWNRSIEDFSLPEYHGAIEVSSSSTGTWWKAMRSYIGPGALVAVGYMDPGNWSTAIAGGSAFGYTLLFVVVVSSLMAMFLQVLALRVGLATNRDLAQACRDSYPKHLVTVLWVVMEVAICATDIAEVIGSAVALKLLFGLPLIGGVCITALDVLLILFMNGRNFRLLEVFVGILIMIITISFITQLAMSQPDAVPLLMGFLPSTELLTNKEMLFIGVGIIGATVMPHNLFLHSSIILTRAVARDEESVKEAMYFGTIDSTVSLCLALFVNASILMVSAATFYKHGYNDVTTLEDAYQLLSPILNSTAASVLFAVALLASGQNSTLTGTLSGQIVMEGFMTWKLSPTFRRVATRLLAIVPSVICIAIGGDGSANYLLILSQVVLSFALPFAMIPLVHISSSRSRMGVFVNSLPTQVLAVAITVVILALNVVLLV